jgi:hypothetical protein
MILHTGSDHYFRLYAITAKVAPTKRSGGMELLETSTFKLQCYQTLTGNPLQHLPYGI